MRKVWLEIKAEESFMIIMNPGDNTGIKLSVKI